MNDNNGFEFYNGDLQGQYFNYYMMLMMMEEADDMDISDDIYPQAPTFGGRVYRQDTYYRQDIPLNTKSSQAYTENYGEYPRGRRYSSPSGANIMVYGAVLFYIILIIMALTMI